MKKRGEKKWKLDRMSREKRKEGKDPEGGSKKRKEVTNDKSLTSMFAVVRH